MPVELPQALYKIYKKYLDMFLLILEKTKIWNGLIEKGNIQTEEILKQTMKQDILTIIVDLNISNIGFAHEPRFALIGIQQILEKLAESTNLQVIHALKLLSKQKACFEGVVGLALNSLYE